MPLFIAIFACVRNDEEKIEILVVCISEMAVAISFKFVMSTPLAGEQLCSKFGFNWMRYKGVKMMFSSCQYTHSVACWHFGLHDIPLCVLIISVNSEKRLESRKLSGQWIHLLMVSKYIIFSFQCHKSECEL